jgi:hypothetical protein
MRIVAARQIDPYGNKICALHRPGVIDRLTSVLGACPGAF